MRACCVVENAPMPAVSRHAIAQPSLAHGQTLNPLLSCGLRWTPRERKPKDSPLASLLLLDSNFMMFLLSCLRFLYPKTSKDETVFLFTNLTVQGLSECLVMHVGHFLAFENVRIDERILLAQVGAKEDYRSWDTISNFIHMSWVLGFELIEREVISLR